MRHLLQGREKMKQKRITPHCEYIHNDIEPVKSVKSALPDQDRLYSIAELFKVFGDMTRVRILYALACTPMCVCDIAAALDMTQSAISHQLRILKQNRLVDFERDGKRIKYSMADSHISTMLDQGMEHISE